ncbi:MAG: hypothetical protein ACPLX8_01205 [Nanopusillaceae archaeon]
MATLTSQPKPEAKTNSPTSNNPKPVTTATKPNQTPVNGSLTNSYFNPKQSVIIGTIPYTPTSVSGANLIPSMTESDLSTQGLVEVHLIPMEMKFNARNFMLYNLVPTNNPSAPPRVTLLTSPESINVTESFSNQMQGSFFEMMLERIMPITQLAQLNFPGYKSIMSGLSKITENAASFVGSATQAIGLGGKDLMNAAGNILSQGISVFGEGSRILWPKIWADSSMNVSYTIPIYLFCNNTGDDKTYQNSIVNPLQILMKYTLPISTSGATYRWPWLTYAVSPGLFVLPEGFISSIIVTKMDVGYNNRPATVKVDLTISSLREVMPQYGANGEIPDVALNISTYLNTLLESKNSSSIPIYQSNLPNNFNPSEVNSGSSKVNSGSGTTTDDFGPNNPGNIRTGGKGYPTLEAGVRAAYKNIFTPIYKHGNESIWDIIHTWAPKKDGNNPDEYARQVQEWSGISYNSIFSSLNKWQQAEVLNAMFRKEGNESWKKSGYNNSSGTHYIYNIIKGM